MENLNLRDLTLNLFSLLKLILNCIISLTPNMVYNVVSPIDSSKASNLDYISVVVYFHTY